MSAVAEPPAAAAPAATLISEVPPVAAPAAGAGPSWIKDDGTFGDGWRDKLPEELRGNPSLQVVGSLGDLAKSYVHTKGLVGTRLEMPGEGATPEAVAAWRKVTGAPERPEGYLGEGQKSLKPETVPDELWDAGAETKFLALAHKHALPPSVVKDILAFHGEQLAGALQTSEATQAEVLKAEGTKLRTAWGQDFDTNLALAARVAQTIGMDPKTHPAFTDASVVQAFAKMGKLLSEDKLVKGEGGGMNATIGSRIQDMTDPKSTSPLARAYRGESGSEQQAAAQKQLHELYAAQNAK